VVSARPREGLFIGIAGNKIINVDDYDSGRSVGATKPNRHIARRVDDDDNDDSQRASPARVDRTVFSVMREHGAHYAREQRELIGYPLLRIEAPGSRGSEVRSQQPQL
jgi:hypothetical protein